MTLSPLWQDVLTFSGTALAVFVVLLCLLVVLAGIGE